MRVLAVLPTYRPRRFQGSVGGGEVSNRLLLEGLARRGHEVFVVTLNSGESGYFEENGVQVFGLGLGGVPGASVWSRLMFFRRVASWARAGSRPDVLITATEGLGVALKLRDTMKVPLALFVRAYENFERPQGARMAARHAIKQITLGDFGPAAVGRVDLLLPNSDFMARYCAARLAGPVPAQVVYPPMDIEPQPSYRPDTIRTVTMVGTSTKKGVEVVRSLARHFPALEFRIVGHPGLKVGDTSRQGNVTLVGWCDVDAEFRETSDLVLVPSLWAEPFGRVAVEAVSAGKMVLVSDIGGLREAVGNEPALMVEAGDREAWRSRLADLLAEPDRYWEAWSRAHSRLGQFGVQTQVDRLEQALCELAEGNSR